MVRSFGRLVTMRMYMDVLARSVFVCMDVDLFGRKQFPKRVYAEQYQHAANDRFQSSFDRFRDLKLKKDDKHSDSEQRDRVTNSPHTSDQGGRYEAFLFAHDRRHRRQMIGLDRVLQTEHEADQQNGNGGEFWSQFHLLFLPSSSSSYSVVCFNHRRR